MLLLLLLTVNRKCVTQLRQETPVPCSQVISSHCVCGAAAHYCGLFVTNCLQNTTKLSRNPWRSDRTTAVATQPHGVFNSTVRTYVSFVVSYAPDFLFAFLHSVVDISLSFNEFLLISLITNYLRFVNCCLNPIVLFVMSKRYRGYIKRFCGQRKVELTAQSAQKHHC